MTHLKTIPPHYLAGAYYFLYFGAAGGFTPYLNLYYQQIGISTYQIGLLAALLTSLTLVASPLWSGIADRFQLHHYLLPLLTILTVPAVALLASVNSFTALIIPVLLFAIAIAPIVPLADYAILSLLGDKSHEYGKLRLWGAVGWGISAWLTGNMIEQFGMRFSFVSYGVLMLLCALIALNLPTPKPRGIENYWQSLYNLIQQRRWLGFMCAVFLGGIALSIFQNYFVLHLTALGASEGLFGLSVASGAVSEIPVFLLIPIILRRRSPRIIIAIAFIMIMLRGFIYATIQNPEWAIAAQLLHGLTFSALWAAGVHHINTLSPEGLGASSQSFFGTVMFGISGIVGALIGSWLYEQMGAAYLFRFAGVSAGLGLLIFILVETAEKRKTTQTV
jgi:MFS transporter, PPP family, 3-phenylpropionic acid transporter